uniref:DUF2244 domain-containing protein n=1 Tax=uncultured Aminicenantes bacterium TaxID=174294 RepID=Q2YZX7_9BACT|nr:hypothetical protein [uncultured Aminicenantes bacterium]
MWTSFLGIVAFFIIPTYSPNPLKPIIFLNTFLLEILCDFANDTPMRTIDITEQDRDHGGLKTLIMTLRPRRSADPRVAYTLCGILAFIWFCAGVYFTFMGGWPIIGFFGGEFIFIAGMVHIFMRRTDVIETVEISPRDITVHRRELGREETKVFPAYWAHVDFSGSPTQNGTLEIRSHGEAIEIGRFLSASEKDRTAWKLNDVLQRLRVTAAEHASAAD